MSACFINAATEPIRTNAERVLLRLVFLHGTGTLNSWDTKENILGDIILTEPQVDFIWESDGASGGPPGELPPALNAADGPPDVFHPVLSLLHVRRLEEVLLLLFRGDLENQLNRRFHLFDTYTPVLSACGEVVEMAPLPSSFQSPGMD